MTGYGSDEAIERLEAAWTCEHLACMEMRGERDRARAVAVALEQEVYLGEWLFAELRWAFRSES